MPLSRRYAAKSFFKSLSCKKRIYYSPLLGCSIGHPRSHRNIIGIFLPVIQATSDVDGLVFCRNRFGFNPGKCFSRVDCVRGLNGAAPDDDADNIECFYIEKRN